MEAIKLPFPWGGEVKRQAFSESGPPTTPDASNVRPDCSILSRERGGSRPGLVKWDSAQPAGANAVRLIGEGFFTSSSTYAKYLYMSAGGALYRYNSAASWTAITGVTLSSDRPLTSCDLLNKVYIAGDSTTDDALVEWNPTGTTAALVSASVTAGTVPTKCFIVCRYRDRVVLAGDRDNPHLVYACRQGDPYDWDDTEEDDQAAWTLSTADAGAIGEPVTALIPHGDDCLLVGSGSSLWVLRSDVTYDGVVDNLSRAVGIIDYTAWCHDSEGNLWFLSHDGLYYMPGGCGSPPYSVSREKIPAELLNIDTSSTTVTLSYDVYARGLHIALNGSSDEAWFVDVRMMNLGDTIKPQGSFWPQSYQATHYPFYQYQRRDEALDQSLVLWGGSDGYLRHHDDTASQDDGSNTFSSYYYITAPMASHGREGVLSTLECVTAANSGDVDIAVQVGNTPEAALAASAFSTHAFNTAGWNRPAYPRARGNAMALKVQNGETNAEWATEEIIVGVESGGRRR